MKFTLENIGLKGYTETWDYQKEVASSVQKGERPSTLIFCEHPTVITIGKNGTEENLTKSEEFYKTYGIEVIANNRGGDVTLHNANQIVAYPIFNLNEFKPDLHWFLRTLEDVVIDTLSEFGISAGRYEGFTGVWIEQKRKVCAMGLHCSRWVTSHGLALNVSNDMSEFEYIVPCGIKEKEVTSIEQELGTAVDKEKVYFVLESKFKKYFS